VTPKGSYNRKRIEENFSGRIEELYRKPYLDLAGPGGTVRVPLWFFRDLGILEDEITRDSRGLHDRNRKLRLPLRPTNRPRIWLVGDLEYEIQGTVVDLGLFARQPILWAGNPALIRFSPCKLGPAAGAGDGPRLSSRPARPSRPDGGYRPAVQHQEHSSSPPQRNPRPDPFFRTEAARRPSR